MNNGKKMSATSKMSISGDWSLGPNKSPMTSCAVVNCQSTKNVVFKFPNPATSKDHFLKWVHLTGNAKLIRLSPTWIYQFCRICCAHFDEQLYNLIVPQHAIPTLHLPVPIDYLYVRILDIDLPQEIDMKHCKSDLSSIQFDEENLLVFDLEDLPYTQEFTDVKSNINVIKPRKTNKNNCVNKESIVKEKLSVNNKSSTSCELTESNPSTIATYANPLNSKINLKDKNLSLGNELLLAAQCDSNVCITEENVQCLCRICLQKMGTEDIFEIRCFNITLHQMMEKCIPVEVERNPKLTTIICSDCKNELIQMYIFVNKCVKSSLNLQAYLKNIVDKTTVSSSEEMENKSEENEEWLEQPLLCGNNVTTNSSEKTGLQASVSPELNDTLENFKISKRKKSVVPRKRFRKQVSYQCQMCLQTFQGKALFFEHCRTENHVPLHKCTLCSKVYLKKYLLTDHLQKHRNEKAAMCDRCGICFFNRFVLFTHIRNNHSETKELDYACSQCDKRFLTNLQLRRHGYIHKKEKPYCCETCGSVFKTCSTLRMHQRYHMDVKPHVCFLCGKGYITRSRLKYHMISHSREQKYECKLCGLAFMRTTNLHRHNKQFHISDEINKNEGTIRCEKCGFNCANSSSLQLHMRRKHKQKCPRKKPPTNEIFPCKYCEKKCKSKTLLMLHIRFHTGEKKYKCKTCNKRFYQSGHLANHNLMHAGIKPYKCNYCKKEFTYQSSLVGHERLHTGETPYKCNICNKGFTHVTNQKRHMLVKHQIKIKPKRTVTKVLLNDEIKDN